MVKPLNHFPLNQPSDSCVCYKSETLRQMWEGYRRVQAEDRGSILAAWHPILNTSHVTPQSTRDFIVQIQQVIGICLKESLCNCSIYKTVIMSFPLHPGAAWWCVCVCAGLVSPDQQVWHFLESIFSVSTINTTLTCYCSGQNQLG